MKELDLQDFMSAFEKVRNEYLRENGDHPTSFEMNPATLELLGILLGERMDVGSGFYEQIRWREMPVIGNPLLGVNIIVAEGDTLNRPLVQLNEDKVRRALAAEPGIKAVDVVEFIENSAKDDFLIFLRKAIDREIAKRDG